MHEAAHGAASPVRNSPEQPHPVIFDFGSVYSAGWSLVLLFIGGPYLVLSHGRDY
jgi:hypothetical protein